MLLLFQVATQQIPPIHVTVLQPPAPPGLQEWVKILISAGTGAVFGIAGNIAMEFIKPRIAKKSLKKFMAAHLLPEARRMLANMKTTKTIAVSSRGKPAALDMVRQVVSRTMSELRWHRYEFYAASEQKTLYEMGWKPSTSRCSNLG